MKVRLAKDPAAPLWTVWCAEPPPAGSKRDGHPDQNYLGGFLTEEGRRKWVEAAGWEVVKE
jgi:hypothetical protein